MNRIASCSNRHGFQILRLACIALLVTLSSPRISKGDFIIGGGYSLYHTTDFTYDFGGPIGLQHFESVPLIDFDFQGDSEDEVPTGDSDTIIKRAGDTDSGNGSGKDTIEIEMVALSLQSVNMIDIGGGAERIKLEIDSSSGSSMDFSYDNMNSGVFDSTLKLLFEFHGVTSGTVLGSGLRTLSTVNTPWQRSTGGLEILDVNSHLKGDGTADWDFHATNGFTWTDGSGTSLTVQSASPVIPEPSSILLLGTGLAGLAVCRRRRTVGAPQQS